LAHHPQAPFTTTCGSRGRGIIQSPSGDTTGAGGVHLQLVCTSCCTHLHWTSANIVGGRQHRMVCLAKRCGCGFYLPLNLGAVVMCHNREQGIEAPPHPPTGATRLDVTTTGKHDVLWVAFRQRRLWTLPPSRAHTARLPTPGHACPPPDFEPCLSMLPSNAAQSSALRAWRTHALTRCGCGWAPAPPTCTATRAAASTCCPSRHVS